jgi:hypothetical protein
MADLVYNSFKTSRLEGSAPNLTTGTIKGMLVTSSYSPLATHSTRSQVTNEVVGAGYTSGGITLANKTLTGTAPVVFDADDLVWTSSTITAHALVLYEDTGNASTDRLIAYFDTGETISVNGTYTHQWNASGILALDVA